MASARYFHKIKDFFVLFAWHFESPKSEFVWRFYGQNSNSYSARKLWLSCLTCDGSTLVSSRASLISDVVTLYHLTPSGWILTPSPSRFSGPSLFILKRDHLRRHKAWRRQLPRQKPYWPVTCNLQIHLFVNEWRRHLMGLTPSGTVLNILLRFCRFLHFYAQKTSKIASFVKFLSKVPKMTKGTT